MAASAKMPESRTWSRRWGRGTYSAQALPDAVQLMTVHAAKGLEFPYIFVMRLNSASFPSNYKEPLVEFPQDLRSRENKAEGDPKALHEQEQRRLLYVAITRAMDNLYLCGKFQKGKDPIPPRYFATGGAEQARVGWGNRTPDAADPIVNRHDARSR